MKRKINYNIEKFRVIASIMVIVIHVSSYIKIEGLNTLMNFQIYRGVTRVAVIYFFAVSGYLISKKKSPKRINNSILNTIKLYIYSSSIYIGLNTLVVILKKILLNESLKKGLLVVLKRINIINILNGTFGSYHLWFFSAYIITLLFYFYFYKNKLSFKTVTIITFFLLITSKLKLINYNRIIIYGGGFPDALLAFWVGTLINEYPNKYKFDYLMIPIFLLFVSLFDYKNLGGISFLLLYVSVYLLLSHYHNNPGKESKLSKYGKHTLSVYIYHDIILKLVRLMWDYFGVNYYKYWYIDFPLVIILSLLLSPVIHKYLYKLFIDIVNYFSKNKLTYD